jgi:hypothetical protein
MKHASSIAGCLLLAAMLGAGSTPAQDQQPRAAEVVNPPEKSPQAQEERAASAEPATRKGDQAPQQRKPPRRSVQQAVGPEPMAPSSAPPALTYGPSLAPRPHEPPSNANSLPPVAPAPVNSCHGSLCTDAAGGGYNIGVGNAGTNGQGRLCNRVGNTVQCF